MHKAAVGGVEPRQAGARDQVFKDAAVLLLLVVVAFVVVVGEGTRVGSSGKGGDRAAREVSEREGEGRKVWNGNGVEWVAFFGRGSP